MEHSKKYSIFFFLCGCFQNGIGIKMAAGREPTAILKGVLLGCQPGVNLGLVLGNDVVDAGLFQIGQ